MSECSSCGTELKLKNQVAGSQISSDEKKPDGAIYKTSCDNCGANQTEKIQELIKNE